MKNNTKKSGLTLKNFPPRIVIKFKDSLDLPYKSDEEIKNYLLKNNIIPLNELLQKFPGIKIGRLFTSVEPEEIIKLVDRAKKLNSEEDKSKPKYEPPDFLKYCAMDCPYEGNPNEIVQMLRMNQNVEFAYVASKPAPSPCIFTGTNPMSTSQGYLEPAPKGIDAKYAWTKNGGCGEGQVQFIDIEYAWALGHEDIQSSGVNFLWGDINFTDENDHGTSVLGVVLMQDNILGGLGITPNVKAQVISRITPLGNNSIEDAILHAIPNLNVGDILLLEVQVFDANLLNVFRPAEIEDTIFRAIELATNNGIIVIEAAGNGDLTRGYNLDDCTDINGKNILDRTNRTDFKESGAIMVGAASATISNGRHSKTRISNYGNRIDCYGWGKKVFTADPAQNPPYTQNFSGTSSASAIVAGAAIAVQSIADAAGKRRVTPYSMRDILSDPLNGTGSRNAIGIMPDLKAIIDNVIPGLP